MYVPVEDNHRFGEGRQEIQFVELLYLVSILDYIEQIAVLLADGEDWHKFYRRVDGVQGIDVYLLLGV